LEGQETHIIALTDGSLLLQEDGTANLCTGFEALPVRSEWYTPWGGPPAVRSFAATTDGCVYADIHVGSIMRSPDQGHTWEPVTPTLHNDVHEVATTPASDNHVAANTISLSISVLTVERLGIIDPTLYKIVMAAELLLIRKIPPLCSVE
jgi:hypothetical protein